jgi:hypothetical protein
MITRSQSLRMQKSAKISVNKKMSVAVKSVSNKSLFADSKSEQRLIRRSPRKQVKYSDEDYIYEEDYNISDDESVYSINIDFDEASAAWKKNKKSVGNGCYTYVKYGMTTRSRSYNN